MQKIATKKIRGEIMKKFWIFSLKSVLLKYEFNLVVNKILLTVNSLLKIYLLRIRIRLSYFLLS